MWNYKLLSQGKWDRLTRHSRPITLFTPLSRRGLDTKKWAFSFPKPFSLLLAGGALAPEGPLMCRGSPSWKKRKGLWGREWLYVGCYEWRGFEVQFSCVVSAGQNVRLNDVFESGTGRGPLSVSPPVSGYLKFLLQLSELWRGWNDNVIGNLMEDT